jgi:hypothetical protein
MAISTVDNVNPQQDVAVFKTTLKEPRRVATGPESAPLNMPEIDIIDIRCDAIEMDLKAEILSMLKPEKGPRKLPTLLLYDEKGLQIFEKVLPAHA